MRALRSLLALAAVTVILSSCATQKKQSMKAHQYFRENPEELATLCGDKFPGKTVYIPGETITTTETDTVTDTVVVTVDCPDGSQVTKECPPNKTITIRDTIRRTDTIDRESIGSAARIEQYRLEAERHKTAAAVAETKQKEAERNLKNAEGLARSRLWIIIGIIVAVVGGAGLYWYLRAKSIVKL